jgi:hypothetical protein
MQYFRRRLLNVLVLTALTVAWVGLARVSSAGEIRPAPPQATAPAPYTSGGDPNNNGEPDVGHTRSQKVRPSSHGSDLAGNTQFANQVIRVVRWTSIVWAKRILGVGE